LIDGQLCLIGPDQKLEVRNGSDLVVKKGQLVPADHTIATFAHFADPIIAEVAGYVRY